MINTDRLVKTFIELVQIDSPSGKESTLATVLNKKLTALGAHVVYDNYGNIIARIEGKGEPFMLNAHMDTVEPGCGIKPYVKDDKIISDGSTILGGDCKAGIAIILEALESLQESNTSHLPLDIVLTREEELGLLGATNLDYSKIQATKGITFDGEEDVTNITVSAPGYTCVDLTIIGRSAHAGAEPEKGISAIKIAAEIITKLKVGRIDEETTANIGLIDGGSARNAVPEKVHIKAEIRSRSIKKLDKHTQHFQKSFNSVMKKYPDAKIELKMQRTFNPYLFQQNHIIIEKITSSLQKLHLKPKLESAGGGTDVNIFHTHGIEAVCVGIGDYNAHTTREYVSIQEMLQATKLCEAIIKV